MTSIRRKQAGLGARRNTVEQEREQFQRNQEASFRKAINEEEVPLKMKHVRNLIIGTHTDKNGSIFWTLVALSPPLHTDITAWKFCHTLHLVLRDGHPNVIIDSFQHIGRLKLLGEHYQHLPSGYGGLIQKYCDLLMCKLNFHQHYPRFPGTLHVTPEELEAIAENDANNYFEMAVEMLEYMEKILKLYEGVFVSLDPSRANSMTKMGQCRLSPLIPCIQDSSCLYDFIVRILFSLHKIVPTDMLSGHRTRFNQQFKCLNSFYNNTRNLQYFKTLIQVPHLPQVPPNFLIEAELRVHVAPVVVLEEEVPDPAEIIQDSVLVDTSEPSPPPVPPHPHPDVVNSHNGSMMEVLAERDSYIDALQEELRETRNAIQTIRSENSYIQEQLKLKINDLESTIAELDSELTAEKLTKESILAQVEAAAASAEAVTKLSDEETRRRLAEEKFVKMKEVYQKLRDEHIALIRLKADLEKTLAEERQLLHEEQDKRKEKEMGVKRLEAQLVEQNLMQKSVETATQERESIEEQLAAVSQERDEVKEARDSLQRTLEEMNEKMSQRVEELENERTALQADLKAAIADKDELQNICSSHEATILELKTSVENILDENKKKQTQLQDQLNELQATKDEEIKNLTENYEKLESVLSSVKSENEERSSNLQQELNCALEEKTELQTIRDQNEKKICDLKAFIENAAEKSEQEQARLKEQLNDLEESKNDEIRKLTEKCENFQVLLTSVKLENEAKEVRLLEQLNDMEVSKNEEIKKLNESYEKLEAVLCSTKLEHQDTRNDLQKELNVTIEEKTKLQKICSSHEDKMSELETTIENTLKKSKLKQADLKNRMNDLEKSKNEEIKKLTENYENLEALLCSVKLENEKRLSNAQNDMENNLEKCIASAVESSVLSITFSLSHFDSEAHRIIKATPEYTILYKGPIEREIESLFTCFKAYCTDIAEADQMVKSIDQLGALVSSFLLYGKATSHASPRIEVAENLVTSLEELSKHSTELLEGVRSKSLNEDDVGAFKRMFQRCCDLVSSCEDLSPSVEDMASSIEREMSSMDNAIREAVEKFSRLLEESRAKDTGIQLEVNEGILATCSELMTAVRLLVQRASELQTEIVAAGKGGASPREFYKRNHRWTEGLISGAKTVAIACRALVKAADDVVMGKGKFEEVIVSSKEIAASSMQLVMASRVKAEKDSQRMSNLNMAAKTISTLTGTVVATAESCRDKVTEATTLDFSKLNLHAAKRLEMETLVKVLETEKKLETERAKLSELRRHHYQLAGELEGWEEKDMRK